MSGVDAQLPAERRDGPELETADGPFLPTHRIAASFADRPAKNRSSIASRCSGREPAQRKCDAVHVLAEGRQLVGSVVLGGLLRR